MENIPTISHRGEITLGDRTFQCAVLSDETSIIIGEFIKGNEFCEQYAIQYADDTGTPQTGMDAIFLPNLIDYLASMYREGRCITDDEIRLGKDAVEIQYYLATEGLKALQDEVYSQD